MPLKNGVSLVHLEEDVRAFVSNTSTDPVPVSGTVTALSALVPTAYNEIALTYSGSNITQVVYKQFGTVVATLTLGYTGSNLTSVVRS